MNKSKYVFTQLIEFRGSKKFRNIVNKYDGIRSVKHLTCWNQLLALMFGQLNNRESQLVWMLTQEAHQSKHYHPLGQEPIAKTAYAIAKQNSYYRIL